MKKENAEDIKHKNKMEELIFERETEVIKFTKILEIERIKHQWKLEEMRIDKAEQRKIIEMKRNIYR